MAQGTDRRKNGDYSCEVLSLIVLFILSAFSHFWYILIAVGIGISLWVGLVLVGRLLLSAAQALPRHRKSLAPLVTTQSEMERDSPEWSRRSLVSARE